MNSPAVVLEEAPVLIPPPVTMLLRAESVFLIDKGEFVRYWWYGELNWQGTPGETWMRDRIAGLPAETPERSSQR